MDRLPVGGGDPFRGQGDSLSIEASSEPTVPFIISYDDAIWGNAMKALAILLSLSAITLLGAAGEAPTLTVVGEGVVLVPADVVYVSITATVQDENLTVASSESSEALNRTIEALIEAGVDEGAFAAGRGRSVSTIQTASRVCNNSTCVVVSDGAVNLVREEVTIRFDAREEALINRSFEVARSEGAEAGIAGYALVDRRAAIAEAREKAIQNAEAEAGALASAAGLKLGERLEIFERSSPLIREPSYAFDPLGMRMTDLFDLSWPVAVDPFETASSAEPGMMEVISQVFVTYRVSP